MSPAPVLTIGSADDGEPAKLFTFIRGVIRLSNGTIVVSDAQTTELRWFDADGAHLATRGGRGEGPGEFTSLPMLIKLPGDTVLAQNAPYIKQVLYDEAATLLREESIDFTRYRSFGRWLECRTLTLPDRSLLGCRPEPGLPSAARDQPGHLRTFSRYVRVPWSMDGAYPLGLYGGIEQWGFAVGGEIRYAVHPFHAHTVVAAGGDPLRVAIALNPAYAIEIWTPDGRLERIVRRTDPRQMSTPAQRAVAREQLREDERVRGAIFNRVMAEMREPDSIPAVLNLTFGPAGDLWVTRHTLRASEDPVTIDVFDRDGNFLGELRFPPRFRLHEVGTDYVVGVRHDANDVPFVELYSLSRSGPAR